jgi:hypothetical protein
MSCCSQGSGSCCRPQGAPWIRAFFNRQLRRLMWKKAMLAVRGLFGGGAQARPSSD